VPIITSMMLHHDAKTFVVVTANPPQAEPAPAPRPLRALAGVALAGLAPLLVEAVVGASRRPR
jgi:hypothetical protein